MPAAHDPLAAVPPAVLSRVRVALSDLRLVADDMRRYRETLDDPRGPVGGGGRYEAEVVVAHRATVEGARGDLARFRGLASRNGVDAEAVILALGGVPDLTPSPAAARYLAEMA